MERNAASAVPVQLQQSSLFEQVAHVLLALADRAGERTYEPELHRLRGELLQGEGADPAEVEACYQRALAVGRRQPAKAWEAAGGRQIGPPLAAAGPAGGGPPIALRGLRLVHRGVRHSRPARGQGAAG